MYCWTCCHWTARWCSRWWECAEAADAEAAGAKWPIHGGGDWKLGRTWPGEWNRMIMKVLREAEVETGRMLTRNEVLDIVAGRMERYYIPMDFIPWIGP